MDVNVWGVARVTKAMIPLMRSNGGRIAVMASGLGRIMQPSRSPYDTESRKNHKKLNFQKNFSVFSKYFL